MTSKFNKRGSIQDALFIGLIGVLIAIGLVFALYLFNAMDGALTDNIDFPTEVQESREEFSGKYVTMLDAMFLIVLFGSYIATFILAFFIDSHPIFFVMTAMVFTATIIVVPFLMNAYQDVAADAGFATTVTSLPITSYIMNHYLQFTIVMWGLVAVGIYSKRVAT